VRARRERTIPARPKWTSDGVIRPSPPWRRWWWYQSLTTLRFFSPCPCTPSSFLAAPSPCAAPTTACGGGTDHSIDLPLLCTLIGSVGGITGAVGMSTAVILLPPGIAFSTQAVVIDPGCASPTFGAALVTQAFMAST
jgi:hypothetical protein